MKENPQKPFFVGIKNPNELRRCTLEASKSVISSMQRQQRVLNIQAEKVTLKEKLKDDVKELKMLFSKLEKILPPNLFETNELNQKTVLKEQVRTPSHIKQIPKMILKENEVNKLHTQLNIIEARLKNLKQD